MVVKKINQLLFLGFILGTGFLSAMHVSYSDDHLQVGEESSPDTEPGTVNCSYITDAEIRTHLFTYDESGKTLPSHEVVDRLILESSEVTNATFAEIVLVYPGLKILNISGCEELSDFSPLTKLTQLRELDCSRCLITNDHVVFIGTLSKLELLDLSVCSKVTDIGSIANLSQLHTLVLDSMEFTSLPVDLSALVNLQELKLYGSLISDVSSLAALQTLHTLRLGACKNVQDITPLFGLINLKIFELYESGITDASFEGNFEALSKLTKLTFLGIGGVGITNDFLSRIRDVLPDCCLE